MACGCGVSELCNILSKFIFKHHERSFWTKNGCYIQSFSRYHQCCPKATLFGLKKFSPNFRVKSFRTELLLKRLKKLWARWKSSSLLKVCDPWCFVQQVGNSFGLPELKGFLAAVDFEARDGLSVDQFISVRLGCQCSCSNLSSTCWTETGCSVCAEHQRGRSWRKRRLGGLDFTR